MPAWDGAPRGAQHVRVGSCHGAGRRHGARGTSFGSPSQTGRPRWTPQHGPLLLTRSSRAAPPLPGREGRAGRGRGSGRAPRCVVEALRHAAEHPGLEPGGGGRHERSITAQPSVPSGRAKQRLRTATWSDGGAPGLAGQRLPAPLRSRCVQRLPETRSPAGTARGRGSADFPGRAPALRGGGFCYGAAENEPGKRRAGPLAIPPGKNESGAAAAMLQDGGEHTGTARSPAGPEGLKERSEHWRDYNSRRASRRAAYGSRRAPRAGAPWPRPAGAVTRAGSMVTR